MFSLFFFILSVPYSYKPLQPLKQTKTWQKVYEIYFGGQERDIFSHGSSAQLGERILEETQMKTD